uniref:Fluorescent Protein n=1 Tax=Ricordea sp. FP2-3 TaxID=1725356 RepID=A0A6G7QPQ6_9CNID|nr:fluorescent Protein [Ricordea sp. FP2-3]
MSKLQKGVEKEMKIKLTMNCTVNERNFVITGQGAGEPYDGTQTLYLTVEGGKTLNFSFDVLTPAFQYGNRAFTKYPGNIPDFFKQTFSGGGYTWKRTMTYEDGGVSTVESDISVQGDCFHYKIQFNGKFPPHGPVMQKETVKWEPSTEVMYKDDKNDGVLKGDVNMALLLKDGGHLRVDFNTSYIPKNKVEKMPDYHFVDHRIEILEKPEGRPVKLYAGAVARYSLLPEKNLNK